MPEARPPRPGPGASRRGPTNRLGWALAALVLAGCFVLVDPEDIAAALSRLAPSELAALLLIATLDRVLMGLKWGLLLRVVGVGLPLARVVRLFYQASLAGVFMPLHVGGDLLRAHWVSRESGSGHLPVLASLVMERLLGLVSAVNWALVGGVVFAAHLAPGHAWPLAGLGLLATAVANVLFVLSLTERAHGFVLRRLGRLGRSRLADMLQRFYTAYADFGRDRRALLLNTILTLLEHGLQITLVVATASSLGIEAGLLALPAGAAVYLLLARLPIAPDGWGVSELTAIGVFGLVGIPPADAFSLSLVGHVVPALALAPGLLLLLLGRRERPAGSPAPPPEGEPLP
jgi:glycosyltransferase 2 family protein